jgi:mono/diheme cytochrome c family protein
LRIAAAGSRTDDPTFGGSGDSFGATPIIRAPAVAMSDLASVQGSPSVPLGCSPGVQYDDGRRATAVGFTGDGRAVVLTRAPTALHIVDSDVYVELPGDDVYDVGHELFFGDTGAGIACASCHAEGGDDGLVWEFEGIGRRRTQELRGGILGTEPFHWDGDMADFRHLAREVFSTRMLGPELPDDYADALATYIDGMPVPAHGDHVDALAAERGRVIFESAEAQCSLCHGGPRLSTPGSFDVGTGGAFQVPSLVGVSLRAPFLHTGCAETLEERFSPDCGGATHGNVSGLTPEELADLIAYLESV